MDGITSVVLVVFLLSAALFILYYNTNQGYWWDEAVYLGLSRNLYEGKGYWINVPGQETFRPPAFPVLAASIWSVSGFSEPLVKILPPLFGLGSVVLVYFFAKRLYNRKAGLLAAAALATAHMFLFYGEKFLTETMFTFLSLAMLYIFYAGIEGNRKYLLPVAGVLMALNFLTRYAGALLVLVYIIYPLIRSSRKNISFAENFRRNLISTIKNWGFWAGLVLAFLVILPWVMQSMTVFGTPFGAMSTGLGTVTSGFYLGDWYFYFAHWFEIFGLIGIFMLPGFVYLITERKNQNNLMLLLMVISFLFFMALPRKEPRYLIHFFEIYFIVISIGVLEAKRWLKSRVVIPIAVVAFLLINLFAGIQMLDNDIMAGASLKEAGLWLGQHAPAGSSIMTNNMPPIYYTSDRWIVNFPANFSDLRAVIAAENVSYLLIESREPTYPEWLWVIDKTKPSDWVKLPSNVLDGFTLEGSYQEHGKTYVWVYRA
jgi:4-amino-4-deoxy-L-arabinose transferase-like glycosyltransferase